MRLDQLHIQNFRCYEDATFDFQPGFNLVVGVNGSGKTSLLQAIAASFFEFGEHVGAKQPCLQAKDIRFVIDSINGRTRLERIDPVRVTAKGHIFNATEWKLVHAGETEPYLVESEIDQQIQTVKNCINTAIRVDLPVLAFYRANRHWKSADVSAEFAAQQRPSRFDGYNNWFDAVAELKDFESWLIGRTLERMQDLLEAKSTPSQYDDELASVNQAIQFAIPGAHSLRYDIRLQSLLISLDGDKTIPFYELSDGQRGMVALFADIARRMCILNPHLGQDVLKNTPGIIIVDELDIHLHPAWQRSVVPALKTAFPKVQFIAASHSPQIIGSLQPAEVILLNDRESSHPRVTYGLDSSRVLEEVMGVSEREPEIENLLSELFSTIEDNDFQKAKTQLQALREKAPDLPEFLRAEALLRRKEIIGR